MTDPTGFEYETRKSGEVVIRHHGRIAVRLRAAQARRFLERIESDDPQQVMARITGNYKRGNERRSR